MFVIFDTETSGLFNFSRPPEAEGQPRLASVAFIFLDDLLKEKDTHYKLVRPDGWEMPYGASKVNGLTNEMLRTQGIPIRNILDAVEFLFSEGHTFVAHNVDFDMKVLEAEFIRAGREFHRPDTFCTMKQTKNICCIPNAQGRNKWPKLTEAHEYFFGEAFANAHEALADARACARIFRYIYPKGLYEEAA